MERSLHSLAAARETRNILSLATGALAARTSSPQPIPRSDYLQAFSAVA